jgi:hypothetical protein
MSISAHVCAYAIDHVEPKSEIQEEESSMSTVVHK